MGFCQTAESARVRGLRRLPEFLISALAFALPALGYEFGQHPCLAGTVPQLVALQKDARRRAQFLDQAERLATQKLTVPTKGGQWVFHYAHPKTGDRLTAKTPDKHWCEATKTWHREEKVVAAYRSILHNRLNRQCLDLAIAYHLTKDEKYARPAKAALLQLARIYPGLERHDRWGRKGLLAAVGGRRYCSLLTEAVQIMVVAKAYDLIYHSKLWTKDARRLVEGNLLSKAINDIEVWGGFVGARNNHRAWFNAAYMTVGIVLGNEKMINQSLRGPGSLSWQLKHSVTASGLWYEGAIAYHFYALSAIEAQLTAAKQIGIDWSANKRLRTLWSGPRALAYPDLGLAAINDSDPANLKSFRSHYDWAAEYFGDPELALGKEFSAPTDSSVFKEAGLAVLRRGKGTDAVCAIVDYGEHGEWHGHPDKLNLLLYARGAEVLPDIGRISYRVPEWMSWSRTTIAHNTVVIDQESQAPTTGSVTHFSVSKAMVTLTAESRKAYTGVTLRRSVVLTERFLVDIYHVGAKPGQIVDWVMHFNGSLEPVPVPGNLVLGKDHGYQHLESLAISKRDQFLIQSNKGTKLRLTLLGTDRKRLTGKAIGFTRKQRLPLVVRRRNGNATYFSILDFQPDKPLSAKMSQQDGRITLRIRFDDQEEGFLYDKASGRVQTISQNAATTGD